MNLQVRVSSFEPARERLDLELVDISHGALQSENSLNRDNGGENQ
jgi:hypothetical protein